MKMKRMVGIAALAAALVVSLGVVAAPAAQVEASAAPVTAAQTEECPICDVGSYVR